MSEIEKKDTPPDVKVDQLVRYVKKVWGHEEWIVNNAKYCGKKLVFKKGYRCSFHHHKIKDETFYVLRGRFLVELDDNKNIRKLLVTPGDVIHVSPGVWHRLTSLDENAVIIEFSTFHMEEDSYRRSVSEKVDLKTLGF